MNDRSPDLTVRLKFVDLDHGRRSQEPTVSSSSISLMPAFVGSSTDRLNFAKLLSKTSDREMAAKADEICLRTGQAVEHGEFENHIEGCEICASRVELQLDFIETLEALLYQRNKPVQSESLHGALLVSTPELKFAICGELEL